MNRVSNPVGPRNKTSPQKSSSFTPTTAMDDDEDNGILNIEISDDEVDVTKKKADRTGQSEADFQAVKREYRVRVENGEVSYTTTPS